MRRAKIIKAMRDILGHADVETTLQIYTDATKELKSAEIINFEAYFRNKKKDNYKRKGTPKKIKKKC